MKNIIIILIALTLIISGCSTKTEDLQEKSSQNNTKLCNDVTCNVPEEKKVEGNIQKIEIFHFHGTNQCYSCKTVGAYAEETVNTYFAEEVKSGRIVFRHINADLPENKELVVKYGATGSSLWIGTYTKDGKFTAEQNVNVWYKINDKEEYMTYLKGIIDDKLIGDFN